MSRYQVFRELQRLHRVWAREIRRADTEGTRLWIQGVVFGLKMAVEVAKKK